MILQLIGAVAVFFSCTLIGIYLGNRESYRIADLSLMKKALAIIKSEIEYAKTPLPEALLNTAQRVDKPISLLFEDFGQKLVQKSANEISDIWGEILESYRKKTYLSDRDIEYFKSLGKTLGYLDVKMQTASLNIVSGYIETEMEMLEETSIRNKKMYRSLGILGGLAIIILMI